MIIAIDLGGTKIRAGLVNEKNIDKILYEPCNAVGTEEEVIGQLCSMIDALMNPEVTAIGIGVPSVVDVGKGIVYDVISIPSWREVHLKEILESKYNVPVSVDNDCNCFALGVSMYDDNIDFTNSVCVTLGTGVGAGVIIDGKLYRGSNVSAGEIGSIPYKDKDFEYYCSSRFFKDKGTSGKELEIDASRGEPAALKTMDEFGRHIGSLVSLIMFTYDPDVIVFGGSISKGFKYFKDSMYEEINKFPYKKSVVQLKIYCSQTEYAGLFGAAAICLGKD